MDELLTDFLSETTDLLDEINGAIVAWEADPGDRERLDLIFRFVHTVKGSSSFLALPRVTALAHAAEDALDKVRRGAHVADTALVTAILRIIDRIAELCARIGTDGVEPAGDDSGWLAPMSGAVPADDDISPLGLDTLDGDATLLDQGWRSIRVPLPLLDSVMTGVTDMVLARNEVARLLRADNQDAASASAFDRLSACIAGMRASVSQMRMQRIGKLFAPMTRIVRDLAQDLGKQVELNIIGGEVEIDREMIENIRDPLTHIVRNAIDHGLEGPAARKRAGKPLTGSLSVAARQSGNQILIEIEDDGAGIAVDRLVAKAVAVKLISAKEAALLSPREKLDLIFAPGLSTADQITAISGRGVGMDVVRANIEKIGGLIDLDNREGQGLKITLRVPMTLTIISGLLVTAADQLFALPRAGVREILLQSSDSVRIDCAGGAEIAIVRGERLALVRLEAVLGRPDTTTDDADRSLVIVRPGTGKCYALSVADVHDHEELVIKPAAPAIMATGIYAGTTLPDNGRPVLLLDPTGLPAVLGIEIDRSDDSAESDAEAAAPIARHADADVQLLLFREADGRTRGIRLSVIERLEDVASADLFDSGGQVQVTLGARMVPVYASALPETGPRIKLLRLFDGVSEICYPISEVVDIVRLPDAMSPAAKVGLVAGVALIGGAPTEIIDPFWLFGTVAAQSIAEPGQRVPLCRIAGDDDSWARHFLAPILEMSGYRVAFGAAAEAETADVVLALA
ncbi:MAG: hypothetical protein RLZZ58_316, partial [Pseudomonadota bacterium]